MTSERAIEILERKTSIPDEGETFEEIEEAFDIAVSALKKNQGEWERVCGGSFIDVYKCSKCNHEPPRKPLPDIKTWGWDFTDFCPWCGADMRLKNSTGQDSLK